MKKGASRRGPLTVQSGPAPGAGALGLALLELKPTAVLAGIGASWEMQFSGATSFGQNILCFHLVAGNRQPNEIHT